MIKLQVHNLADFKKLSYYRRYMPILDAYKRYENCEIMKFFNRPLVIAVLSDFLPVCEQNTHMPTNEV